MATATQRQPRKPADTKTKVVVPIEGIDAQVIETKTTDEGTQRISYPAKIIEDENTETENNDQTENSDSEDYSFADLENESFADSQKIPKTELEKMFDNVRRAIESENLPDSFIAMLVRQPDFAMNIRYNVPCGQPTNCGYFQFTSRDLFNFDAAIQERNSNSGGIFNIRIFKNDQTPLLLKRNRYNYDMRHEPIEIEVGLVNYAVPNPVKIDLPINGQTTGNESAILALIDKLDSRLDAMMNRPQPSNPLQDTMMQALVTKMTNDIINPPQNNNNNSAADIVANIMQGVAVSTAIGDAMAQNINRVPPPPPEKNTFEMILEAANSEAGLGVLSTLQDLSEVAKAKMLQGAPVTDQTQTTQNPNEPEQKQETMEDLILDIIDELETENKLDADNEFIKNLQIEYPTQANMLVAVCKGMEFDKVFAMLDQQLAKINPHPFLPFIDLEQTQATNKYVWNERGLKMLERLKEFYEFVKSIE